ncbi:MAG: carbon-nitrogen hydrolase family protein [Proteobacteria bacterium]|nr:carbon-nitrogen hydrolase family protein [Pseudomonadota bacterium]
MDKAYDWDTPPSATGAPARLTVATCQIPVIHDIAANAESIAGLIRQAAEAGADVAHFPECAISGYGPASWPDWQVYPWTVLESAIDRVRQAARDSGIWVVAGTVRRGDTPSRPTNAIIVIDRQGRIAGQYDKQRCSVNDLRAFDPGSAPLTVDIDGVSCGFLICLDWAFPELWQEYAGRGTDIPFLRQR